MIKNNSDKSETVAPSALSIQPEKSVEVSQVSNNSSVPKNEIKDENCSENEYKNRLAKCKSDVEKLTGAKLKLIYSGEYTSWRNSKYRAKLKGIPFSADMSEFAGFLKTLGPKPNADDTLDQIEPGDGYTPGNTRWASKKLQSENRTNALLLPVGETVMTIQEIAAKTGRSYDAVRMRFSRGATVEELLHAPVSPPAFAKQKKSGKIEDWPWPEEQEGRWEESYQAYRAELRRKESDSRPQSRVDYFYLTSKKNYEDLQRAARDMCPDEMSPAFNAKSHFWHRQYLFAREALAKARIQNQAVKAVFASMKYL